MAAFWWPGTYGSGGWASWANSRERQETRTRLEKEREAAAQPNPNFTTHCQRAGRNPSPWQEGTHRLNSVIGNFDE
jgi:hypothetical protein